MRTPLFAEHQALNARIVEFSGWEMPVHYSGILHEHNAVRRDVGVFDISHMGEFFVSGENASLWLDSLLTNRVASLGLGEAQYSLLLNEKGGVIDDLIVYRIGAKDFLLVVNAAKIEEDAAWMCGRSIAGVDFQNRSDAYAALAVQGPNSARVFAELFSEPMPTSRNVITRPDATSFAVTTGYTGELGFEWIVPAVEAVPAWRAALACGAAPCGLGARDTLRLEMGYPLNGSDLSPTHTPLEAGLGFFVDLQKADFVGRSALMAQKETGITLRLVALCVEEKSPPLRSHYPIFSGTTLLGETTSGAHSPSLGVGIAMAYLPAASATVGTTVEIEVRGRRFRACVRKKPLYQKTS